MSNIDLFQGFNSFNLMPKSTVLTGTPNSQASFNSEVYIKVCTSLEEIHKSVEVDASVSVAFASYSADVKASYLNSLDVTTYSVTVILYANTSTTTSRNTVDLPPEKAAGLNDKVALLDFIKKNGDSWVSQISVGSEYIGAITFRSRDLKEKTEVEASLSGKGVVDGVTIDASVATKIANTLHTTNVEYEIKHYSGGTTLAGPYPGQNINDIDAMVEYALKFPTVEADKPVMISFKLEGYEDQLGSAADFTNVVANRKSYYGTPGLIGWGGIKQSLLLALNSSKDLKKLYSHYGQVDDDFEARLAQIRLDVDATTKYIDFVAEDPLEVVPFNDPASYNYGSPEPDYILKVPVANAWLNGGGGGAYKDVELIQIGQLVRLDSLQFRHGNWIDGFTATYSTQFPPTSFTKVHGGGGGGQDAEWELSPSDSITSMKGNLGRTTLIYCVGTIQFTTRKNNVWNTSPPTTTFNSEWTIKENQTLVGFSGSSGDYLDCIQPLVVEFSPTIWNTSNIN